MPISSVSQVGSNYPSLPPPNGLPALSCVLLDQLADISKTLASHGSEGISGATAYGSILLNHLAEISSKLQSLS